ncbi:peptidoglycan-binding protein [Aetokthonos hydrillicola Thurmond2011]|jgi:peptidoglycan hydrolase-like protein with peptidoglycan-binding domain|uniref:Peptidoglycan-binding protein n=1 Tax=Aetokthonos hydrillicola Thurmond2011 TaxID=2712845 RepID=A0AAP5I7T5_9CYAN|nr:peptidoglycan-binding domain-containing protein [Aetokthonos hydrillicola]MBW4584468.1 peptidoglycan-binding protein [Aetokthonos hydrillicola CCALA 1050]MDR9896431.1 peptidoglycan-binding protein [Aetokthonos hydrillicola Thurmond2011]
MTSTTEAQGPATSANLYNDMPTLSNGTVSEGVRLVQQILIRCYHYEITFDADFGPQTEETVKDFQRKHHITVDGIVGVQTWRTLIGSACKPRP